MDKEKDKLVLNINKTKQTNKRRKTTEGTYLYSVMKTNTCINDSTNRYVIIITILDLNIHLHNRQIADDNTK